ncbi:MAG: SPOR domain-containing protein [Thioalkalispiraceae bacterium]|jgi:TPR repeat protein
MTKLSLYLVSCLFLISSNLLVTVPAFADNLAALTAQQNGDYQAAARMWQEMANDGDVAAQYNLALLYQSGTGVNQDQNLARYWMTMAARQGLAMAYHRLNARSVQPSEDRIAVQQLITSPQAWVVAQDPGHYTLQLASSTNRDLIQKYFEQNQLRGKAGYYSSMRQGERWYALVYGSYPSVNEAKEAISDLPQDLRKWSPWVRNIHSIQKIMIKE